MADFDIGELLRAGRADRRAVQAEIYTEIARMIEAGLNNAVIRRHCEARAEDLQSRQGAED